MTTEDRTTATQALTPAELKSIVEAGYDAIAPKCLVCPEAHYDASRIRIRRPAPRALCAGGLRAQARMLRRGAHHANDRHT